MACTPSILFHMSTPNLKARTSSSAFHLCCLVGRQQAASMLMTSLWCPHLQAGGELCVLLVLSGITLAEGWPLSWLRLPQPQLFLLQGSTGISQTRSCDVVFECQSPLRWLQGEAMHH